MAEGHNSWPMEPLRRQIRVALAIIVDGGRLLIARRPPGVPLAGYWEFPGGKQEPGETPQQTAVREAAEEVGLSIVAVETWSSTTQDYPHGEVTLTPVICRRAAGEARPIHCTEVKWIIPAELAEYQFPTGNDDLLKRLMAEPLPAQ